MRIETMRLLFAAPLLLALAACGDDEPPANASNAAVAPVIYRPKAVMLGGVDLAMPVRAGGAGAGWTLDVMPGTIAFTERDGDDPVDFYPVDPKVASGRAVYLTQTPKGEAVTITLSAVECTAGSGDGVAPLTVELKIGDRIRKGCAAPRPLDAVKAELANSVAEANNYTY